MKLNIVIFAIQVIFISSAFGGEVAPYTEEAFDKIEAAAKMASPLTNNDSKFSEETAYRLLEKQREIFIAAGYSYDATLKKVAKDLQSINSPIPKNMVTVAGGIVASIHMMMSECDYQKIDCLQRYPADVAEAIRAIFKNSKFGM